MSKIEYLYGVHDALIAWAEDQTPENRFRDDARAIGIARNGAINAVVIYDTFSTNSCFVHLVSDRSRRWMTREYIIRVFAYPFLQCGFHRVNCIVNENNHDSLRIIRHFGWVEEGRLREEGEDGGDILVFGMLRRECRWLPPMIGGTGKITPITV